MIDRDDMEVFLAHWGQSSFRVPEKVCRRSPMVMMRVMGRNEGANPVQRKRATLLGLPFLCFFCKRNQPLHISQSGPFSMEQAATCSSWVISAAAAEGCSLYFLSTVNLMASVAALVRR